MLINDTLKNGTSRIGLYGSAPTGVYPCFINFQKAYASVWKKWCFISVVLKSVALSYTPDSEHILEIAMCSKNKQSLHEVFHLHKKDYIWDKHAI